MFVGAIKYIPQQTHVRLVVYIVGFSVAKMVKRPRDRVFSGTDIYVR